MTDFTEAGVLTRNRSAVSGGREGYIYALDARSGSLLWSFTAGGPVQSSPISYAVNGRHASLLRRQFAVCICASPIESECRASLRPADFHTRLGHGRPRVACRSRRRAQRGCAAAGRAERVGVVEPAVRPLGQRTSVRGPAGRCRRPGEGTHASEHRVRARRIADGRRTAGRAVHHGGGRRRHARRDSPRVGPTGDQGRRRVRELRDDDGAAKWDVQDAHASRT